MRITEKFRDRILCAMPELAQKDADKIAAIERCSFMTVYNHWRRLKELDGEVSTIMIALGELAISKKKDAFNVHKRIEKITKQLSAA